MSPLNLQATPGHSWEADNNDYHLQEPKRLLSWQNLLILASPSRVRFDDNVYHLKSPKREGHSQKLVASKLIGLCESLHGQDLMMTSLQKTVGWENYPNVPTSTAINDKINGEYSNILQWLFANTIFELFPRAIHLSTFALTRRVHV